MHIRVPFLKDFEFARPQLYAGLMLLGLLAAAIAHAYWPVAIKEAGIAPLTNGDPVDIAEPHDAILMFRAATVSLYAARLVTPTPAIREPGGMFAVVTRSPFILFGLWLGGALWWVTRRLYNNAGGYIALALYCSSSLIVALSSHVNAEIIAAWGLFGIVYTAIGVAHTLYAPPQKWRPRIVLLGAAFGITAAAHLSTALVGLVLAGFFMLYLAPGRRLASLVILVEASVLGFLILWACYGFSAAVFGVDVGDALRISSGLLQAPLLAASTLPLLLLFAVSLLTFLLWPRTRYFGNWAPLLVFTLLAIVRFGQGESVDWALPFAFVFIGGIFADLFETRWRRYAIAAALLAVAGQALLAIARLGAG